jgi:hypothetical protein
MPNIHLAFTVGALVQTRHFETRALAHGCVLLSTATRQAHPALNGDQVGLFH